jgi:hypothetical protein
MVPQIVHRESSGEERTFVGWRFDAGGHITEISKRIVAQMALNGVEQLMPVLVDSYQKPVAFVFLEARSHQKYNHFTLPHRSSGHSASA